MVSGDRADRGQLVLAGAVVVAVAVIGAGLLLSVGPGTAPTAAADETREAVRTAETYRTAVEADLDRLVAATGGTEPPTEAALRANLTEYRRHRSLALARSTPATLDVRLTGASPPSYTFRLRFTSPSLEYETTIPITWEAP